MGSKKRPPPGDDLSDDSDIIALNGQTTPPSNPQSAAFKSPEKLGSIHAASDAGEETSSMLKSRKKRKATMASYAPEPQRLWSKDDELVVLMGMLDYQNKTGVSYQSDRGAFFDDIKNDLSAQFSKDQLLSKIRKMKQRFQHHLAKKTCFTKPHDFEVFDLSMKIWGKDKAPVVDGDMDKAEGSKSRSKSKAQQAFVEHESVTNGGLANGEDDKLPSENVEKRMENENETGEKESEEDEPENDDESAKGDDPCDDELPNENLDKSMENEASGKETEDEMLALQDALEMTMFQNLGKYAHKLMLGKLKTIGAKERKELSDEWKALLLQEMLLKCKKQFFAAKLAKAALDDD